VQIALICCIILKRFKCCAKERGLNRIGRNRFLNVCLVFLLVFSSFTGQSYASSVNNLFSAPIAMQILPNNAVRLFVDEGSFSFSIEKTEKIFLEFLSINKKDLWVNLTPNDPVSALSLSYTDIAPVFLRTDLRFKKDISRLLFPLALESDKDLEFFPIFWIEPLKARLVKYRDGVWAVKSLGLRVRMKMSKGMPDYVKSIVAPLNKMVSNHDAYKELRDLYAIYVLAVHFKRYLSKKSDKLYGNTILPFVSGRPFDPLFFKRLYMQDFMKDVNKSFRGESFVYYLGGVNFGRKPFIGKIKSRDDFREMGWEKGRELLFLPQKDLYSIEQVYVHLPVDRAKIKEAAGQISGVVFPCRLDLVVPDEDVEFCKGLGLYAMPETRFKKLIGSNKGILSNGVLLIDSAERPIVKDIRRSMDLNVVLYGQQGPLNLVELLKKRGIGLTLVRRIIAQAVSDLPFYYRYGVLEGLPRITEDGYSFYFDAKNLFGLDSLFLFCNNSNRLADFARIYQVLFPKLRRLYSIQEQGNISKIKFSSGMLISDFLVSYELPERGMLTLAYELGLGAGMAYAIGMNSGSLDDYTVFSKGGRLRAVCFSQDKAGNAADLIRVFDELQRRLRVSDRFLLWKMANAFLMGVSYGIRDAVFAIEDNAAFFALSNGSLDDSEFVLQRLQQIIPQRVLDGLIMSMSDKFSLILPHISVAEVKGNKSKFMFHFNRASSAIYMFWGSIVRKPAFISGISAMAFLLMPAAGAFGKMVADTMYSGNLQVLDPQNMISIFSGGMLACFAKPKHTKSLKKKLKKKNRIKKTKPKLLLSKSSKEEALISYLNQVIDDPESFDKIRGVIYKNISILEKRLNKIDDLNEFIIRIRSIDKMMQLLPALSDKLKQDEIMDLVARVLPLFRWAQRASLQAKGLSIDLRAGYEASLLLFSKLDLDSTFPSKSIQELVDRFFHLFLENILTPVSKDEFLTDSLLRLMDIIEFRLNLSNARNSLDNQSVYSVIDAYAIILSFASELPVFEQRGADIHVLKGRLLEFVPKDYRLKLSKLSSGSKNLNVFSYRTVETILLKGYNELLRKTKERVIQMVRDNSFNPLYLPQCVLIGIFTKDAEFVDGIVNTKHSRAHLRDIMYDIFSKSVPICSLKGSKQQVSGSYSIIRDKLVKPYPEIALWYAIFDNANVKMRSFVYSMLSEVLEKSEKHAVCNSIADRIIRSSELIDKFSERFESIPAEFSYLILQAMAYNPRSSKSKLSPLASKALKQWSVIKKEHSLKAMELAVSLMAYANIYGLSKEEEDVLLKYIIERIRSFASGEIDMPFGIISAAISEIPDKMLGTNASAIIRAFIRLQSLPIDRIDNFFAIKSAQGLINKVIKSAFHVNSYDLLQDLSDALNPFYAKLKVAGKDLPIQVYARMLIVYQDIQYLAIITGENDLAVKISNDIEAVGISQQDLRRVDKNLSRYIISKSLLIDYVSNRNTSKDNLKSIAIDFDYYNENFPELFAWIFPLIINSADDYGLKLFGEKALDYAKTNSQLNFAAGNLFKSYVVLRNRDELSADDLEDMLYNLEEVGAIFMNWTGYTPKGDVIDDVLDLCKNNRLAIPQGIRDFLTAYLVVAAGVESHETRYFLQNNYFESAKKSRKEFKKVYGMLLDMPIKDKLKKRLLMDAIRCAVFKEDEEPLVGKVSIYLNKMIKNISDSLRMRHSDKKKDKKTAKRLLLEAGAEWKELNYAFYSDDVRSAYKDEISSLYQRADKYPAAQKLLKSMLDVIALLDNDYNSARPASVLVSYLFTHVDKLSEEDRAFCMELASIRAWSMPLLYGLWQDEDVRYGVYELMQKLLEKRIAGLFDQRVIISKFNGIDLTYDRQTTANNVKGEYTAERYKLGPKGRVYNISFEGISLSVPREILNNRLAEDISLERKFIKDMEQWTLYKQQRVISIVFFSRQDGIIINKDALIESSDKMPLLDVFGIAYNDLINDDYDDNGQNQGPSQDRDKAMKSALEDLLEEGGKGKKIPTIYKSNSFVLIEDKLVDLGMDRSKAGVIALALNHIFPDMRGLQADLIRMVMNAKNLNFALFEIAKFIAKNSSVEDKEFIKYVVANMPVKMPLAYREYFILGNSRFNGKIRLNQSLKNMSEDLLQKLGLILGCDLHYAMAYKPGNKDKASMILFKIIAFDKSYWQELLGQKFKAAFKRISRIASSTVLSSAKKTERILYILKNAFAADPVMNADVEGAYMLFRQFYPNIQDKRLLIKEKDIPKGGVVL